MTKKSQRVRVREADDAIFIPQSNIKGPNIDRNFRQAPKREVVCYTMFGQHEELDEDGYPILVNSDPEDSSLAFAKTIKVNDGNTKYFAKRAPDGRFFSPLGLDEGRHNKFLKHAGKNEFVFRQVSKRSFDFYVEFLKTKNLANLRNAEREAF